MGYVAMAYFGMLPLGSLLIGAVSLQIGAPNAIFCQGVMALVIAGIFARFLRKDELDKKNRESMEQAEDIAIKEI